MTEKCRVQASVISSLGLESRVSTGSRGGLGEGEACPRDEAVRDRHARRHDRDGEGAPRDRAAPGLHHHGVGARQREGVGHLEIGNSDSHGTRPFYYNHLDDPMDSDQ